MPKSVPHLVIVRAAVYTYCYHCNVQEDAQIYYGTDAVSLYGTHGSLGLMNMCVDFYGREQRCSWADRPDRKFCFNRRGGRFVTQYPTSRYVAFASIDTGS